jgi:hypothetical protein
LNNEARLASGFGPDISMSRRGLVVGSVVSVRKSVDYLHIVYNISPPGNKEATMDAMKLRFRIKGRGGGRITVWWHRPRKYRNDHPHHMFGLGAVEIVHNLEAFDAEEVARVSF